jgi:hypothetical protein
LSKSRRDFIKTTAAIGLLGISEASAAPPTNVCVVSTIPFAGFDLEKSFKSGLGKIAGTYLTPIDSQGYDLPTLEAAVRRAGSDGQTLVVTLGGLICGQAAQNVNQYPFISLVGGVDKFSDAPSGNFLGGVSLDAYKHNIDRFNFLSRKGIGVDEVCLLYNSNSAMASTEAGSFTYSQDAKIDHTNAGNALTIYTAAFNSIGEIKDSDGNLPGIQAVIVSADPFFTQVKDDLKRVAANFAYYVVYPLKEYKPGKSGHSTIHAPKRNLSELYKGMGKKAKAVLNGQSAGWDHEGLDIPDEQ